MPRVIWLRGLSKPSQQVQVPKGNLVIGCVLWHWPNHFWGEVLEGMGRLFAATRFKKE